MFTSDMSGCCSASVVYKLGGAEGVIRKSRRQFLFELLRVLNDYINTPLLATTIDVQVPERLILEELGFITIQSQRRIFVHIFTGSKHDLRSKIKEALYSIEYEYKTAFKGKILSATIQGFIKKYGRDSKQITDELNNYYKLDAFALDEPYVRSHLNSRFNRAESFKLLRDRIYRLVVKHRELKEER